MNLPVRRRWPSLRVIPCQVWAAAAYLLWAGVAYLPQAAAQARSEHLFQQRLHATVQNAHLGGQIGVSVVDLRSGRPVFRLGAGRPLNPASNIKILTAAVALLELGSDYRFRTALYGRQQQHRVVGGLYLRGFGDPSLDTGDFLQLAHELSLHGVTDVDELVVDGTFYDAQVLPPAFEQQPEEAAAFRAAVAAVSVNRNAYLVRVSPGAEAGQPAAVTLDTPAYVELDNQVKTSAGRRLNVVAVQHGHAGKMLLKLSGTVPLGITGVSYRRRVAAPLQYAGLVMRDALTAAGIQVAAPVRVDRTASGVALLVQHVSQPLSQILRELGKYSDNFVAEMVLKALAAEREGAPGSSVAGTQVVLRRLRALGVSTDTMTLINGSGLFVGNQVAADHFTTLLRAMTKQNQCWPEFLSQLSVAGQDGTLQDRLRTLPDGVIVRAKTGTLSDAIALSGYVLGRSENRGYAFSMLANGIRGHHQATRDMMDALVAALADRLVAQGPSPRQLQGRAQK